MGVWRDGASGGVGYQDEQLQGATWDWQNKSRVDPEAVGTRLGSYRELGQVGV